MAAGVEFDTTVAASVEGSQLLEAPEDVARIEVIWRLDSQRCDVPGRTAERICGEDRPHEWSTSPRAHGGRPPARSGTGRSRTNRARIGQAAPAPLKGSPKLTDAAVRGDVRDVCHWRHLVAAILSGTSSLSATATAERARRVTCGLAVSVGSRCTGGTLRSNSAPITSATR